MSSSQTVASKGKNTAPADKTKAVWDVRSKECYINLCVEQMLAPGHALGAPFGKEWNTITAKFNTAMKTNLHKSQLSNFWFVLKKDWQLWQHLVLAETGLGRDPCTGAIEASQEWWDNKIMVQPKCERFRDCPLFMEEQMRILFGSNTATGEHEESPTQLQNPPRRSHGSQSRPSQVTIEVDNIDALLNDDAEVQELVHPTNVSQKRQLEEPVAAKRVKGKKGTVSSRLEGMLQQLCDSNDTASSVQRPVDNIPTIAECKAVLNEIPQFVCDKEGWAQAFSLFGQARVRSIFMQCDDNEKRYFYLVHELKKERVKHLGETWFAPGPGMD